MGNMGSTPFAKWRENGELDPHGEFYSQNVGNIICGDLDSRIIAAALITNGAQTSIKWLTAGKEHLRWLSRKLYQLAEDHHGINERRAKLSLGNLTDDELANAFFLSESKEDLQAGHDRIMWLLKEIEQIS